MLRRKIINILAGLLYSDCGNSLEDPARVRRSVLQVVVDPSRQHLLRETHHVRLDVEMFVAPHLARGSSSSLDLIHHQGDVVLLTNLLQSLEKVGAAVIVTALRLDGLRDDARHRLTVLSLKKINFKLICETRRSILGSDCLMRKN